MRMFSSPRKDMGQFGCQAYIVFSYRILKDSVGIIMKNHLFCPQVVVWKVDCDIENLVFGTRIQVFNRHFYIQESMLIGRI